MRSIVLAWTVFAATLQTSLADVSCYTENLCLPVPHCSRRSLPSPTCSWYADRCYAETNIDRALRYLSSAASDLKGQDVIIERVVGLLRLKMADWDKRLNLHLAGDNGVGKTWLAKTIGAALSMKPSPQFPGSGTNFHMVDIAPYGNMGTANDTALNAARDALLREIEAVVRRCPKAVILVDELETLHPKVASALIPVLKGNPVGGAPTKSTTFILTSDFGREGASLGMSRSQIERQVYDFSAGLYTDLTIANYVTILPFTPLTSADFQAIAAARFRRLPCIMPEIRCVAWDRDAVKVVADAALRGIKERNGRELDSKFETLVGIQIAARIGVQPIVPKAPVRRLNVTVKGDASRLTVAVTIGGPPLASNSAHASQEL